MNCLNENQIAGYVDQVLPLNEMLEVYEHLLRCPKCLEAVAFTSKCVREFEKQGTGNGTT
jgi:anti-sigma factor RsiW